MMGTCKNCAWYCHADGKCYGNLALLEGKEVGWKANTETGCRAWAFDGLEDWEREPEEALMTMEA